MKYTLIRGLTLILVLNCSRLPAQVGMKIEPDPFQVVVQETKTLNVTLSDAHGNAVEGGRLFFFPLREGGMVPTSGVEVDTLGNVTGMEPGTYNVVIGWTDQEQFVREFFQVQVLHAPVESVELQNVPQKLYAGSALPLDVQVVDQKGFVLEDARITISSSNKKVATVDELFNLYTHATGSSNITIVSDGVSSKLKIKVEANPVKSIKLSVDHTDARTGDVLRFTTTALDQEGKEIQNVPYYYSVATSVRESGAGSSAIINQEGRFVAEKAGYYTILASSGDFSTRKTVKIRPRDVGRRIEMTGQGSVSDKHTSDFWVWEGVDGEDYAVTGTWGADGKAYFWKVTDPASIQLIDSIQVDARTVNDVKISEDGRTCVISREGASNRKNGIVIFDVSNPSEVLEISTFTEGLTGGVHNLYIYKDHVYALSNSQRYDVISIKDPAKPVKVGKFELDNPSRAIHDVWIEDGIAYSSNWNDGVVMVDVGNGIAGGSPEKPVEISRSKVEGDANHSAFPFHSKSTGKFFVVAGDEIFPITAMDDMAALKPIVPAGYLHFMDFSDPDNPREVARYEVPEAGSHNFWVEDDLLYIGYYTGGLRIVDISGELMGDLYKQGREVAHFLPMDRNGYIPNVPMVWGAQPHKGHIFFSDFNSGLWAAKLTPLFPRKP